MPHVQQILGNTCQVGTQILGRMAFPVRWERKPRVWASKREAVAGGNGSRRGEKGFPILLPGREPENKDREKDKSPKTRGETLVLPQGPLGSQTLQTLN